MCGAPCQIASCTPWRSSCHGPRTTWTAIPASTLRRTWNRHGFRLKKNHKNWGKMGKYTPPSWMILDNPCPIFYHFCPWKKAWNKSVRPLKLLKWELHGTTRHLLFIWPRPSLWPPWCLLRCAVTAWQAVRIHHECHDICAPTTLKRLNHAAPIAEWSFEVEALFGIDLLVRVSRLEILDEVTFDDTPVTALQWVPYGSLVGRGSFMFGLALCIFEFRLLRASTATCWTLRPLGAKM